MNKKEIAELWIKNHESRKDNFRTNYLEPYLKKVVRSLPKDSRILDIGCGWGSVADFIRTDQEYVGVDENKEYFPYIKKRNRKKKIKLVEGKLPDKLNIKEKYFDLVVCSMVLHNISNLVQAINEAASKSKSKLLIIDFNDKEEKVLLSSSTCKKIRKNGKDGLTGVTKLPSGIEVPFKAYFHNEKKYVSRD